MVVVIDTNVWISAWHFGAKLGPPRQAIDKAAGEDVIATCREMDAEVVRVLVNKFGFDAERVRHVLQTARGDTLQVELGGQVRVCRARKMTYFWSAPHWWEPIF